MISLCSVIHRTRLENDARFPAWEDRLLESIKRFATSCISEIVLVYVTGDSIVRVNKDHPRRNIANIPIKRFVLNTGLPGGHAYGLHVALDNTTKEHVMFCDPDVFFYRDVPKFFLEVMEEQELFIIGVGHHRADHQAFLNFPSVVCSLMRRDDLPPASWLAGSIFYRQPGLTVRAMFENQESIRTDGKYLMPGPPIGHWAKFPKSTGLFDVGCNLWLWNLEKQGRWISFTPQPFRERQDVVYRGGALNSNFKFVAPNDTRWRRNLLYHKTANGEDQHFFDEYRAAVG